MGFALHPWLASYPLSLYWIWRLPCGHSMSGSNLNASRGGDGAAMASSQASHASRGLYVEGSSSGIKVEAKTPASSTNHAANKAAPPSQFVPAFYHTFGIRGHSLRRNIFFIDQHHILFSIGRSIAVLNVEKGDVKRYFANPSCLRIDALGLSHNLRYLAICEKLEHSYEISVMDLTTMRRTGQPLSSPEFIRPYSVAFSKDAKQLITVSYSGSDMNTACTVIHWERVPHPKVLSTIRMESDEKVNDASINPWNPHEFLCVGSKVVKFFKYKKDILEGVQPIFDLLPMQEDGDDVNTSGEQNGGASGGKQYHFTDHLWVNDGQYIVTTADAQVLVFEKNQVRDVISNIFPRGCEILCISNTSRGFIVGGMDGHIAVFEGSASKRKSFTILKRFKVDQAQTILGLSVSPYGTEIACFFRNHTLGYSSLANLDSIDDGGTMESSALCQSHYGSVNSIDVCVQRPLIITCGSDNTVKVWNYLSKKLLVSAEMDDEPLSVCIHSSGFLGFVSFRRKIRCYRIFAQDMQLYKEVPIRTVCKELRLSNGNQYLGAAVGNDLFIFDAYTFRQLRMFRGHSRAIKSIAWSDKDDCILSAGDDGAIYEWKMFAPGINNLPSSGDDRTAAIGAVPGHTTANEYLNKNIQYMNVQYVQDSERLIAFGFHKESRRSVVQEISDGQVHAVYESNRRDAVITRGCISVDPENDIFSANGPQYHLFLGTSDGCITQYFLGAKESLIPSLVPVAVNPTSLLRIHAGSLKHMLVSPDGNFFITTSTDGSIFVFRTSDGVLRDDILRDTMDDIILIPRTEMVAKNNQMVFLENKVKDVQLQAESKIKKIQERADKALEAQKKEAEKYFQELQQEHIVFRDMKEQEEERLYARMMKAEEQVALTASKIERRYEKKLAAEIARNRKLTEELQDAKIKAEEELFLLQQRYEKSQDMTSAEFQKRENQLKDKLRKLDYEVDLSKKEAQELLDQQEQEYEWEMTVQKDQAQAELSKQRMATYSLKGETVVLRNKYNSHIQEMEKYKANLRESHQELRNHRKMNEELEQKIEAQRRELTEKDEFIYEKERRNSELKQRNQELEKYKVVLGYKLEAMKQDIGPMGKKITDLLKQIREMEDEFEANYVQKTTLESQLKEKQQTVQLYKEELQRLKVTVERKEKLINDFCCDLYECVHDKNPSTWRKEMSNLYQRYIVPRQSEMENRVKSKAERTKEYETHRQMLEKHLMLSQKRGEMAEKQVQGNAQKHIQQNAFLLQEVNELRKDNRSLRIQLQKAENNLRDLHQHIQRCYNEEGGMADARWFNASTASYLSGMAPMQLGSHPGSRTNSVPQTPYNVTAHGNRSMGMGTKEQSQSAVDKLLQAYAADTDMHSSFGGTSVVAFESNGAELASIGSSRDVDSHKYPPQERGREKERFKASRSRSVTPTRMQAESPTQKAYVSMSGVAVSGSFTEDQNPAATSQEQPRSKTSLGFIPKRSKPVLPPRSSGGETGRERSKPKSGGRKNLGSRGSSARLDGFMDDDMKTLKSVQDIRVGAEGAIQGSKAGKTSGKLVPSPQKAVNVRSLVSQPTTFSADDLLKQSGTSLMATSHVGSAVTVEKETVEDFRGESAVFVQESAGGTVDTDGATNSGDVTSPGGERERERETETQTNGNGEQVVVVRGLSPFS